MERGASRCTWPRPIRRFSASCSRAPKVIGSGSSRTANEFPMNSKSNLATSALYVPITLVQKFGKYYLLRKLAEGGMAEIFLAKQVGAEGFERDVVVKRMLEHLTNSSDE